MTTERNAYLYVIEKEGEQLYNTAKLLGDTESEIREVLEDILSEALKVLYHKDCSQCKMGYVIPP